MNIFLDAWRYAVDHSAELAGALADHLWLVTIALSVSVAACIPLGIWTARSRVVSGALPSWLLGGGYRYVGQETIVDGCPHVEVVPATPWSDGCGDCRQLGADRAELRVCLQGG